MSIEGSRFEGGQSINPGTFGRDPGGRGEFGVRGANGDELENSNFKVRGIVRWAVKVFSNRGRISVFDIIKVLGEAFCAGETGFANIKGRGVWT